MKKALITGITGQDGAYLGVPGELPKPGDQGFEWESGRSTIWFAEKVSLAWNTAPNGTPVSAQDKTHVDHRH